MADVDTILTFLKFGRQEHILDLYHNGTIYMNPIQYFRTCEDNSLRGDGYEGVLKIANYGEGEFEIKKLNYKGKFLRLHIAEKSEIVLGNIYSLYCVSSRTIPDPRNFKIDERVKDFGDYCLMVKNNSEFLRRINSAMQKMKLKYDADFVEYYDKSVFCGDIHLFQKPDIFKYQNEFRFYVERDSANPLIVRIGNLEDIAAIMQTNDIVETLRLKLPDD